MLLLFLILCAAKPYVYRYTGTWLDPRLPLTLQLGCEILYAALLIAVFFALLKDICALGYTVCRLVMHDRLSPWPKNWIALGIALVALGQAAYGTLTQFSLPEVKVIPLQVKALPSELSGLRVVQLSDLHIGPLLKGDFLHKVVDRVNALQPDVVVITGDLVDGSVAALGSEFAALEKIKAPVYAVTGNHEYYSGVSSWLHEFARRGVHFLQNEAIMLQRENARVKIAGVPDQGADVAKALSGELADYTILLSHRPSVVRAAQGADLVLTGHTHGGTMFFLQPLIAHFNDDLVSGSYQRGDQQIYVSNGTGIWSGFSCRFAVPAEITCFVLRAAAPVA